jgi:hypothetical protein
LKIAIKLWYPAAPPAHLNPSPLPESQHPVSIQIPHIHILKNVFPSTVCSTAPTILRFYRFSYSSTISTRMILWSRIGFRDSQLTRQLDSVLVALPQTSRPKPPRAQSTSMSLLVTTGSSSSLTQRVLLPRYFSYAHQTPSRIPLKTSGQQLTFLLPHRLHSSLHH